MKKIAKKEKIKSAKNPPPLKIKLKSGDDNSQFAENIINTVREPLIVLDHELKIVTASRSFYSFFKVIPEETIGKLLYDLGNHQWDIPKLRELLETILPEKTTFDNYEVEHDFSTIGKRIMLLNARQIKRAFGKEKIILLAIEDITERKEIEDGLEKTREELAVIKKSADEVSDFAVSVINTVREPLIALDQDLRVVKASRSFFDFFKVSFDETIGTLIYDLGNQQWNIPKLRELLETILPEKTTFDNYEVEHDFSTIGKRIMLLNARQIKRAFGKEKIILLAIEDITERRRVEESLSEKSRITEEYLNILLNHAHAPIIIWDPSLAIKRFNREFEKLSGYLWTEVQDKKIDMLFPEDKIDSTIELIKNNIGDENSEVIEINILTKNKDIKTVLWNSANILDKEGKNIVATIAQDITNRKRAEEALKQERDFSRTIVQTSPTFFVAIGSDGKTIIMNDSMLQTLGYTLSEVVGKDYLTNFVPLEDREKLSKIFEVLVTTNKPTVNENPILSKDGRKIIVEWHGKNILKPNGELDYFFGIGTDITERKRAEEKLLKSKQQYDSLVSKIPVGIYILHTVPEGTFVLDYVSPKMAEMFDVSVESLLADSQIVIQSIHPDDRDEFVNLNQEGIRLLRPFDWKGRVLTTKGVKWMHLVSSPELQQNRDVLWHGLVVDITERKLAEEKLQESEERFRITAENLTDVIYDWDIKENIRWYGDIDGITGYPPGGFPRTLEAWTVILHPEDKDRVTAALEDHLKRVATYAIEYRIRRRDGEWRWWSARGTALRNDRGEPYRMVGSITDITERKLAEAALKTSEERYRLLFEESVDGILIANNETKTFEYANPAVCRMLGYTEEELRTLTLAEIHPKQDLRRIIATFESQARGDKTQALDIPCLRKDGSILYADINSVPILIEGRPYLLGLFRDITERKQAEEALRESEEKYKTITQSTVDVIFTLDKSGKLLFFNESVERVLGYKVEEVIGKSFTKFVQKKDLIKLFNEIKNIFQHKEISSFVTQIYHKDGHLVDVEINGKLIKQKGKFVAQGSIRDITERKQVQKALQESEKRYHQVIQNASDIILTTDINGNILFGNNASLSITGYSLEEITKMNYMELAIPEFRRKLQFFYMRQFKNKISTTYLEYPIKNISGETIWLGQNTNLIFENDKINGFHLLARDITERKQAEEALRESEVRYRTTIDNSNDLIQSVTPDGSFMFVNPTWQLKLGYSQEEVSHLNLYDVIHPDSISHCRPLFEKIMSGDNVPHMEVTFITKDGKPIYLEGSATPRLLDGKVIATQSFFHDITERKLSEVALREREQLFRGVFNASPMAIILMDPHNPTILWPIIDCNEATCLMNGFTREELIGHTIDVLNARQGSREESDDYFKKLKKEGIIHVDVVHRHKDGHLFPVEASTTVVTLGGHEMVLGIDHDITERKRAEESLRQSQSLYHSFIEQLPYPVFRKDIEGRYVLVNSQFCKLKGLKKEDFVGKTPMEVTMNELEMQGKQGQATKYADVGEDVHELIMRTGKIIETEEEYPGTNGVKQFMHVVRMPVLDFDGKVIGIQGIMSDISERKRAEEEITMLAHSLKSINECVSITDLEDTILFVNESYLKTYGYDENELLGKHISIVRSLKNPPELVKEILPSSLEGGWKGELWNKRKDGSEFMIYLSTKVINDKDDKAFGLIGVATDITERKRGERELIEAKEKAEQSDKLKSEFLAQMSHEIRTPLNAIVGNVEYLNGSFGEKMDSDTRDCFDGIDLASKRIIRTVDLILNAAELQTSGYKPHFVKIDLTDILDKLYQEHQLSAKLKGLEITYTCKEKDAKVIADEYSTIQIFANLIDNAIKYTKKGKVEIHLEKDKTGNIMVEVKDSGIGISKEFLSRIFEPFTQEEQGYNRSFEGNGLGLALVKNYCNINNVLIEVESEKNVGSTFRIIFN